MKSFLNQFGCFVTGILFLLASTAQPVRAIQISHERILVPMGGGYSDLYEGWSKIIAERVKSNTVKILVLPTTYSSNSDAITESERKKNITDAEARRFEIEQSCQRNVSQAVICKAKLVTVFTRSDALEPKYLAYFTEDIDAIFILGGDQTVAMRVIAGTPLELAMQTAYDKGAVLGGTSAGGGMLSSAMLAGYNPNYVMDNSLDFGASDVWNSPTTHGLPFTVSGAIFDQHFYQRSRLGRLLNAIAQPGAPQVGIGIDAYTGLRVVNETALEGVFGLYTVTILDAATYHSADAVRYLGPQHTLSLRNILVHLLVPGQYSYDISTKRFSSIAIQQKIVRGFEGLQPLGGSGDLWLSGDISPTLENNPALADFLTAAGGQKARILVVGTAYPSDSSSKTNAEKFARALNIESSILVVPLKDDSVIKIPDGISGILVTGRDQSKIKPAQFEMIKQAWLKGIPLFLDNAAAAMAGLEFSAHPPTPKDTDGAEIATQKSFLKGRTILAAGLGLVNANFEPQVLNDNRWGRLFSIAYHHPKTVAFGIAQNSVIRLSKSVPEVIGKNEVISLDLRFASLGYGQNDAYSIGNGLMDVFPAGDKIVAKTADIDEIPTREPTPELLEPVSTITEILPIPTINPTQPIISTPKITQAEIPVVVEATPTLKQTSSANNEISNNGSVPHGEIVLIVILMLAGIIAIVLTKFRKP